jgi:uncharacterized protein YbjQ (UPF0145 family)
MAWFGKNKSGATADANPGRQQQDNGLSPTQRAAAWDRGLANNELPDFVTTRLTDAASGKTPWLSTMTPAELLLSRSHGMRPIATVSGTCWFHYGFSWTKGHAEGWRTAIARIKHEATILGANAIVDVKLRRIQMAVENSMDFTVIGTAVKIDGLPASCDPIVATVPALEFVRLLEAGIVPVGLAIGADYQWLGNAIGFTVGGTGFVQTSYAGAGTWWNQPLTQLGNFWEQIRRTALSELAADARGQGNGVLAHTHFGELIRFEGDQNTPTRFLGRHIVMGTVVDTGGSRGLPHEIGMVVDMRDGASPFREENRIRTEGPVHDESGEI